MYPSLSCPCTQPREESDGPKPYPSSPNNSFPSPWRVHVHMHTHWHTEIYKLYYICSLYIQREYTLSFPISHIYGCVANEDGTEGGQQTLYLSTSWLFKFFFSYLDGTFWNEKPRMYLYFLIPQWLPCPKALGKPVYLCGGRRGLWARRSPLEWKMHWHHGPPISFLCPSWEISLPLRLQGLTTPGVEGISRKGIGLYC